jgi:hypothetical protein
MRTLFISLLVTISMVIPQLASPASAHTPVILLESDTTPGSGPLLVDGTISFAVRASFTESGQNKAFRTVLKEGQELVVEYLIVDKKPENTFPNTKLPLLVITSPSGQVQIVELNERTDFYYPGLKTNFIYLARYKTTAEAGTYQLVVTSRERSSIVLGVGKKEIPGEVRRDRAIPCYRINPVSC